MLCSHCRKNLPANLFERNGKPQKTCNACAEKRAAPKSEEPFRQCQHCHHKYFGDLQRPFWRRVDDVVKSGKENTTCNKCFLEKDDSWLKEMRKYKEVWKDGKVELTVYFTLGFGIPDCWVPVESMLDYSQWPTYKEPEKSDYNKPWGGLLYT